MTVTAIYNPQHIEEHWQQWWEELELFQQSERQEGLATDKMYMLFAFAYPSGSGLHVGHVESKTALDIMARFYRMHGKQVFFPVGWDAFGLPAENYAIKTGIPPVETTKNAINTFRRQIKRLAISYDWANEIATCHPGYYKWTQWLFLQMYKKGMAYRGIGMVNWCPQDQTVLANEQVVNGACERCGTKVIQKELEQWYFKITHYQDELLTGLDTVDWPEPTKQQQRHWIGKSEGIEISYQVDGVDEKITCFTTRPDTNFGVTFIALAPEHVFAQKIARGEIVAPEKSEDIRKGVANYIEQTKGKTELDRQIEGRKKTGTFTGFYAINNLTGKKVPIWISDFVLAGFGTGALVGVPGHDLRDFQFATQFGIPVERVVVSSDGDVSPIEREEQVQEDDGTMINSGFLDGLDVHQATEKIMDHLEEKGWGKRVTSYKLRDWLISRQRYWGAPIPIVYDPEGKAHPVKEEHLPWMLPTDVDFKPTGESPLKSSREFIERTERLYGKGWRPEFDTMDTFVDSSWYYLRYLDSRNEQQFANPAQLAKWLPVDLYMIGPEHIVLHLLYSRFFTKFLRDEGYLTISEPFQKMRHQGMILGPDNKKMSKSKGNVINPDEVIEKFGADTLRVYEMFMGPIESDKPWDTRAVAGVYRFLQRVFDRVMEWSLTPGQSQEATPVRRKLHQTIQKVSADIPKLKYNTAIAAMMELMNEWEKAKVDVLNTEDVQSLIRLLAPFAPFMAEELWQTVHTGAQQSPLESVHLQSWPTFDAALAVAENVILPVQVNGKVRGQIVISPEEVDDKDLVVAKAQAETKVQSFLVGKTVQKIIYVPGKIINLVV